MFGDREKIEKLERDIVELNSRIGYFKDELATKERLTTTLKHDHVMALKEMEFKMSHHKDTELKKLEGVNNQLTEDNAVLKNKVEMMEKIVTVNADIIDVKELVNKLIDKLPEVKLNSVTVMQNGNGKA